MFEREVMISMLRKHQNDLRQLVEELEGYYRWDVQKISYCQETLKKIESGLKKIRKMEEPVDFAA